MIKMMLKIPYFKQEGMLHCGPTALRMAIAYLGKDPQIKTIIEKTGIKEGKGLSTIEIAIAATTFNYDVKLYSKHISFNEENQKLDYYKNYSDIDLEQTKKLIETAKAKGVKLEEKTLPIEEILGFVTENSVVIILLDWNIVKEERKKSYLGHFVPIVGYDEKYIYVHDAGINNPKKFMPIKRQIFDEARKAKGTDEDIVVICKSN